jgi:hypothetical protein
MRLPLRNDNSSMVINLHCCFEVDARFLQLNDNLYQILSTGTCLTRDKFKKVILHAFTFLSPYLLYI